MADETTQSAAESTDVAATAEETTTQETQQTGDPNALAAQQAVADAEKPWYSSLPDSTHEALKDFKDPEELAAAALRGKNYTPAESVEDFKIEFANSPEGIEEVAKAYSEFCLEKGIPPTVAQELVTWQENLASETTRKMLEAGEAELAERWGDKIDANKAQALVALQMLDRKMEGRLAPVADLQGLTKDPVVVEALYHIAQAISEESLGGSKAPGAEEKEIEPVEQFRNMGFK